jgi:hypothetical protein
MFAGHFGVGFGLKRWAPALSLGTLFLAAQWVDLVWPTLLLLDLEHVRNEPGATKLTPLDFYDYPLTHSLLAACLWAVGFALGYGLLSRSKWAAGVCAFGVISHWGLDLLVHRPDLLLVPGGELRLGLGGGTPSWRPWCWRRYFLAVGSGCMLGRPRRWMGLADGDFTGWWDSSRSFKSAI